MRDWQATEKPRGRLLLLVALVIASVTTGGCASLPWSRSVDPLSPNFDPDLYRDVLKKQRARKLPPEQTAPSAAQKLRDGDEARASGDTMRAMWSYLQAHKLDADDPIPVERIAMLHMKKDPQRSEALFAQLALEHPKRPSVPTGIGLARLAKDDLVGARAFLSRALELDPEWAPALAALAVTSDRQGHPEEAQALYLRALAVANYETLNNLGVSYIASGRYPEAVGVLRKALLIEHRDPAVHNNLGLALGRLERYDEALRAFQQAGDEASALNNLAYVHFLNGDYAEAVALYEQALLIGSEHTVTVLHNFGRARRALSESQKPVAVIR
jgi:Flp pilus assembly protein TadD